MRTTNPRPNRRHISKLESLPADQRQQLDTWLNEGVTYGDIVQRLASEFGVKTGSGSLSAYYSRHFARATTAGDSELRDLRVSEGTIEFEILARIRIRRSDLMGLTGAREARSANTK